MGRDGKEEGIDLRMMRHFISLHGDGTERNARDAATALRCIGGT